MADAKPQKNERISTFKAVLILVAILLLEGATIGVTIWLTGPSQASGESQTQSDPESGNQLVELLVVREKFPNMRTGRQVLYDLEVYITTRQKDNQDDRLKERLESRRAQVIMEIGTIVRRAEPAIFNEPTLATLRRQLQAVLDERLGTDEQGESLVQEVLITRCTPFRSDF